jgi:sugar lactone lactonase YvrE
MFLEFPNLGGRPSSKRSPLTAAVHFLQSIQILRTLLLPVLVLGLAGGCHRSSTATDTPGTPPAITTGPADISTITGRPASFTVVATGAVTLRYQWAKDGLNILGALGSTYTLTSPKVQDSGHYTVTITNPNGSITSAPGTLTVAAAVSFLSPVGLVSDVSGNLFVSDTDDHTIWKVTTAHVKTLLAGGSGLPGSADGTGSTARFRSPGCLALDAAGNLLVADTGNHTIRRIAPDGSVTTLAGSPGIAGAVDAVGSLARFNAPFGLAVSGTGGMYISDSQNHTIRFMAANGTVTTYAGMAGLPGGTNGSPASAQFNQPNGLALAPNGTLYVADYGNSCVRAISTSAGVTTFAGQSGTHGFIDASGTAALFYWPVGIAADAAGVLWLTDTHNHAIRRLTADGTVSLVAGFGSLGNADGIGKEALFNLPCGIATTPAGNVVVADTFNHILRSVTPTNTVTSLTTP